jgi:hypothetical protein
MSDDRYSRAAVYGPSASGNEGPVAPMSRRALLAALGASPIGLMLDAPLKAEGIDHTQRYLSDDEYFLSADNPVANVDERYLNALLIKIFARDDVQTAVKRASGAWSVVTDAVYSQEQMGRFESAMSDYGVKCIQYAVNSDPNFPRILRTDCPGGRWLGNEVPASKWGGDNPDNAYRLIPLEYEGRFEIRGRRQKRPSAYASYQLLSDPNMPSSIGAPLEQQSMDIAADGSFVLTLDKTPPGGRKNHFQLTPNVNHLMVRDSMADWQETPNSLRIRRLNAPSRGPVTEEEIATRAVFNILTGVYFAYYAIRIVMNTAPQSLKRPSFTTAAGGMSTQVTSYGYFRLNDDEAIIITTTAADAAFRNIVLHDMWNRALEYRNHQSHLNSSQMAPDADGRFTAVISIRDPGVHNWLDPQGLHDLLVGHRWQGLPPGAAATVGVEDRVARFDRLEAALPQGVRRVTTAERAQQIKMRQRGYDRRFIES